jgi:hypothetical protein
MKLASFAAASLDSKKLKKMADFWPEGPVNNS